jgi:hypothetical protein
MTGLRARCAQILSEGRYDTHQETVDRLEAFVIAEIGRSASTQFEKSAPLCLYFTADADREEFIEIFMAAKPNVVTRKMP